MTSVDRIIDYEMGDLSGEDTLKLFQELVDTGLAWKLQGHYGRTARVLIAAGLVASPNAADKKEKENA